IALNPGYTLAYLDLVKLNEQVGHFDQVKKLLLEIKAKKPDNIPVRLKLAEFYYNTQSKNKALKHYNYLVSHSREKITSRYAE
ncbi:hypothetical protein DF186_21135, partial [Enterococcus hirae]